MRRLAGFGAIVVAVDADERGLLELARGHPDRIEPLALDPRCSARWADIAAAWGTEPLHVFLDMTLLAPEAATRMGRALADLDALTGALRAGLRRGQATGVIALPVPDRGAARAQVALAAAARAILPELATRSRPARLAGVEIGTGGPWDADRLTALGDAVLMLCHPVSRAVVAGTVVSCEAGTIGARAALDEATAETS
ncbi:hypothetical protein [Litorisediminicola beolgyonensis]|uniref:Uncharacterized protein n=1 Tax=Litorisediminicola beolgyonensis TaxID=1173614 RepID=A0ABW3ZLH0_9RHOB